MLTDSSTHQEAEHSVKLTLRDLKLLRWLDDALGGVGGVGIDDLKEGFVLLQLLSLLCSSAVDLGWYSSPDGIACEDVKRRIFEDFKRGIRCANITDKDISETLIQTAYLGQAEACIQVLAALKRIYQGRRERASHLSEANGGKMRAPVNESSSSVAVNPEHEMTEFGEDTWKHEYEPTEQAFKVAVRWLLLFVKHSANKDFEAHEIDILLGDLQGTSRSISSVRLIPCLCNGRLYEAAAASIFDSGPDDYLDQLAGHGYLNFKASLRDSVRDMIRDDTPFYESIHCNLIEAFMAASCREISIGNIVDHLRTYFPAYDISTLFPYDLEDALVIWTNQCISLMRKSWTRVNDSDGSLNSPSIMEEVDDLEHGVASGEALRLIFALYFPEGDDFASYPTLKDSGENWLSLTSAFSHINLHITWEPNEMATIANKQSGGAIIRLILMTILCQLFEVCQKLGSTDPLTAINNIRRGILKGTLSDKSPGIEGTSFAKRRPTRNNESLMLKSAGKTSMIQKKSRENNSKADYSQPLSKSLKTAMVAGGASAFVPEDTTKPPGEDVVNEQGTNDTLRKGAEDEKKKENPKPQTEKKKNGIRGSQTKNKKTILHEEKHVEAEETDKAPGTEETDKAPKTLAHRDGFHFKKNVDKMQTEESPDTKVPIPDKDIKRPAEQKLRARRKKSTTTSQSNNSEAGLHCSGVQGGESSKASILAPKGSSEDDTSVDKHCVSQQQNTNEEASSRYHQATLPLSACDPLVHTQDAEFSIGPVKYDDKKHKARINECGRGIKSDVLTALNVENTAHETSLGKISRELDTPSKEHSRETELSSQRAINEPPKMPRETAERTPKVDGKEDCQKSCAKRRNETARVKRDVVRRASHPQSFPTVEGETERATFTFEPANQMRYDEKHESAILSAQKWLRESFKAVRNNTEIPKSQISAGNDDDFGLGDMPNFGCTYDPISKQVAKLQTAEKSPAVCLPIIQIRGAHSPKEVAESRVTALPPIHHNVSVISVAAEIGMRENRTEYDGRQDSRYGSREAGTTKPGPVEDLCRKRFQNMSIAVQDKESPNERRVQVEQSHGHQKVSKPLSRSTTVTRLHDSESVTSNQSNPVDEPPHVIIGLSESTAADEDPATNTAVSCPVGTFSELVDGGRIVVHSMAEALLADSDEEDIGDTSEVLAVQNTTNGLAGKDDPALMMEIPQAMSVEEREPDQSKYRVSHAQKLPYSSDSQETLDRPYSGRSLQTTSIRIAAPSSETSRPDVATKGEDLEDGDWTTDDESPLSSKVVGSQPAAPMIQDDTNEWTTEEEEPPHNVAKPKIRASRKRSRPTSTMRKKKPTNSTTTASSKVTDTAVAKSTATSKRAPNKKLPTSNTTSTHKASEPTIQAKEQSKSGSNTTARLSRGLNEAGHPVAPAAEPTSRPNSKQKASSPPRTRPQTGLMLYPLEESDADSSSSEEYTSIWDYEQRKSSPQTSSHAVDHQKGNPAKAVERQETTQSYEGQNRHSPKKSPQKTVQKPAERLEEIKARKLETLRRIEAARVADRERVAKTKEEEMTGKEEQRRERQEAQRQDLERRARELAEKRATEKEAVTPQSATRRASSAASSTKRRTTVAKEQSNRQLIRNALIHVCLAGSVNEKCKADVLEDLERTSSTHFLILFHQPSSHVFRGLYSYDPKLDQALKIYPGTQGPDVLDPGTVQEFYKYDSGARTFKRVPTKSFGRSVHAVAIGREWGAKGKGMAKVRG